MAANRHNEKERSSFIALEYKSTKELMGFHQETPESSRQMELLNNSAINCKYWGS